MSDQPKPGTYRTEIDVEYRNPTAEAIVEAHLSASERRLASYTQQAAEERSQREIRKARILETPRLGFIGWSVFAIVEFIGVLLALSALFNSGIGFTRTSVLFAIACVLFPLIPTAIVYGVRDNDIREHADRGY